MTNSDGTTRPCKCKWRRGCRMGDECGSPNINEDRPGCYLSLKKPFKLQSTRGKRK